MLPIVAVVGRPNVGKSTIFNRIIGNRLSITDDQPGVTRDRIYSKASWLGVNFNLIDTGGIELSDTPFIDEIKAQAEIAMDEADVIIFITDITNGVTDDDMFVTQLLRKTKKPVFLAVNKVDDKSHFDAIYEFYALGLGDPIGVSGLHGIGIGDLLDAVVNSFPDKDANDYEDDVIKFSLLGRPNVGKSSLANKILGEERVIVSDLAGTTRDAIDSSFEKDGNKFVVIDTAGIRKSGKVYENAEKYSVLRALSAIDRSDVCLILINAEEGIIDQDKKIAGYAKDAGKATIIVVNKWDAIKKDDKTMHEWELNIRSHFQFIPYAPIVFLSALTGSKVNNIYEQILVAYENYNKRVQTNVLNDIILDATTRNPSPFYKGKRAKIYYASQVNIKPPTFVIFMNDPDLLHFTYKRYIENTIRDNFDFTGTPIKVIYRIRD